MLIEIQNTMRLKTCPPFCLLLKYLSINYRILSYIRIKIMQIVNDKRTIKSSLLYQRDKDIFRNNLNVILIN